MARITIQPVDPPQTGICSCGCGGITPPAKVSCRRDGTIKGQATKWLKGHYARSKNPHNPAPLEQRFWTHVCQSDGCWVWTGFRSKQGYGQVQVRGKAVGAHRISYELTYGLIPTGLFVCHSCDNPPCVRPDHLFLGTRKDNAQDAGKKGRLRKQSELTPEKIRMIRHLYATGQRTTRDLAKQYGVGSQTIYGIVQHKYWRHVD